MAAAGEFMTASMAAETIRGYSRDWRNWVDYAQSHGLIVLPADPQHVCAFLAAYSRTHKAATTERAAMAIGKAHRLAGLINPVDHEHVRRLLAGIRRTKGIATDGAAPLLTEDIARLVAVAGDDLRGLRDQAMLLAGFVGAFRRSELLALDVEDLEQRPEGFIARIRRSKTDQEGAGRLKTLPWAADRHELCPVRAIKAWQLAGDIWAGPLWRPVHRNRTNLLDGRFGDRAFANVIKALCAKAGLDPEPYSPHSLRAGHITEAKRRGAEDLDVMNQSHHSRVESVFGYYRDSDPFARTSAKFLGL